MERFLKRHRGRSIGSIGGFDRLLFRGSLLSICHRDGRDKFLGSQDVLDKDWGPFVQRISARVKAHAERLGQEAGRPFASELVGFNEPTIQRSNRSMH